MSPNESFYVSYPSRRSVGIWRRFRCGTEHLKF